MNILEQLSNIIITIFPNKGEIDINFETNLYDIGFDSISLMELILNVENLFNIEIDPNNIDPSNIANISYLIAYIEEQLIQEMK